jgi:hypothetical protein
VRYGLGLSAAQRDSLHCTTTHCHPEICPPDSYRSRTRWRRVALGHAWHHPVYGDDILAYIIDGYSWPARFLSQTVLDSLERLARNSEGDNNELPTCLSRFAVVSENIGHILLRRTWRFRDASTQLQRLVASI